MSSSEPILPLVLAFLVVDAVIVWVVLRGRRTGLTSSAVPASAQPSPLLSPGPTPVLSAAVVAEISRLVNQGRKIQAIKALRVATGVGLKEAKDRIDGWSDVVELRAAENAGVPDGERLRIEAGAVVSASGWHAADAFLREERGLTPEASRALLDSLT